MTRLTSEAEIIALLAPLALGHEGAFGLMDDCAVLRPRPGMDLVLKTDPVRAGVHFFANDDPADIGWKALAVNVSDLAAKGATPIAYLMSLCFPEPPAHDWMTAFARGLDEAQKAFGCTLVGGDTDRAPGPISITITAIGEVPAGKTVRRGSARPGDILFVSGCIGDSGLGLHARTNDFARRFWPIDRDERDYLRRRYLRPEPRLALGPALREYASAAMDVSDGLAKDLSRMAAASGIAATLDVAKVPMSTAAAKIAANSAEWRVKIVSTGDDYEILAAVAPDRAAGFKVAAQAAGITVSEIGRFAAGSGLTVIGADGAAITLDRTGWDHF